MFLPMLERVCNPHQTVLTFLEEDVDAVRVLIVHFSFTVEMFCIISRDKPFDI